MPATGCRLGPPTTHVVDVHVVEHRHFATTPLCPTIVPHAPNTVRHLSQQLRCTNESTLETRQREKGRHRKLQRSWLILQGVEKPEELQGYEVRVMSPVPVLKKRTAGGLGTGELRRKQGRCFHTTAPRTPLPRHFGAHLLFLDSQARIVSTAKGLEALWRGASSGVASLA